MKLSVLVRRGAAFQKNGDVICTAAKAWKKEKTHSLEQICLKNLNCKPSHLLVVYSQWIKVLTSQTLQSSRCFFVASNGALHDHEELPGSCRLNDPTTGEDLFSKVQETLTWDLAGKKLTSLTASDGRNVCGPDILRTNVRGITRAGSESPMLLSCIIQGALCCNFFSGH